MLNCIIVDDEQSALDALAALIGQSDLLHLAKAFTSPTEALAFANQQPIDLAFLDIQMPGINGLQLAQAMRGLCKVIFTTGHSEFVSDAYHLQDQVVDYLLKPIGLPRLMMAAQHAIRAITNQPVAVTPISLEQDYLFVKAEQRGKWQLIDMVDIIYLEGEKNYISIHHGNQKTLVLMNMKEVEERLPPAHFVRVHKSFIVALRKVASIEGNYIALKTGRTDIPIGDTYKAQLVETIKGKTLG
jgi:two-component system, LytTR family, response regulator